MEQQIGQWLKETTGADQVAVRSASAELERAHTHPQFLACLLSFASVGSDKGQCIAAATYLKNFLKNNWSKTNIISQSERMSFRNGFVDSLLRAEPLVLKSLAEALRMVLVEDFVRENTWPELIPSMKLAVQNSSLIGSSTTELKTLNVLIAVQVMTKPFQYFMNPSLAKEPVPEQLELIVSQLLVPLFTLFHHLTEQVKASKEKAVAEHDPILLVLCKSFHLAIRSHMPVSLLPDLGVFFEDILVLLDSVVLERNLGELENVPRMKVWKRSLQICCTLASRHRKHVDKFLPSMCAAVLKIVKSSAGVQDLHPLQERIVSLAFDAASNILEIGPGWRLMAPHFSSLLEDAIFPALKLKEKDIVEWRNDEAEYLRKNLPSDLDEASGWRDDLFTPRRSALNLLGLISISKGPPSAANNSVSNKRKKGGKNKGGQSKAGDLLIIPFLSKFGLPPDGAFHSSDVVMNYFGVLLAYGGLQKFFEMQRPERVLMLLQLRVLPLYSMSQPCAMLLANANWLLGELATCLPEDLKKEIYECLIKAFSAPNMKLGEGDISWSPVRKSAAGALSALLQENYEPVDWLPLLQAAVSGAISKDDSDEDASVSFQLLATIAEAGQEKVASHVPAIASAVQLEICKWIPPIPEPCPQVVESGFSAMAALVEAWESSEPEDSEEPSETWKASCHTISSTCAQVLQQAWLPSSQENNASPAPSSLNDASVLLRVVLKYASDADSVVGWRVEHLLQAWSNLIAEWNAWDEEEDLAVFTTIEEALALHGKYPLPHFAVAAIPPPLALPVASSLSILEGIVIFVTSAIKSAYSAAVWRACRIVHSLLHALFSTRNEEMAPTLVSAFTEAALTRLFELRNMKVALSKPLILVIAMCYVYSPQSTCKAFSDPQNKAFGDDALLRWIESLADLTSSESHPSLSLESELKLSVCALLKVLEELVSQSVDPNTRLAQVRQKCFRSSLHGWLHLMEVQEANSDEDGDAEEEEDDSGDDEDDDDSEDDEDSDEDEEHEETEEQFLERYAKVARELEQEVIEEGEGGEDEDGYELNLGVLGPIDMKQTLCSFLQTHGNRLLSEQPLPEELSAKYRESIPEISIYFH